MRIEEAERLAQQTEEEMQERFKQDLMIMGATLEEVEERYQRVWGDD